MKLKKSYQAILLLLVTANAAALDSACNPIVTASEIRMKLSSWHAIALINDSMRMESMKVNGGFYKQVTGKWEKSPISFDTAEREMLAQMKSGEVKISHCKVVGSETVDGVPVMILAYRVEMKGAPAADAKLYIGKSDGLPYKQIGQGLNVSYKYKNISPPK